MSTYWNVGRIIVEHEQENNKRQISTSLYERLLLSEGKTNKETVLAPAEKGIEMSTPLDIIKDPYVFEFLGMPENKPMLESDLEKGIEAGILKIQPLHNLIPYLRPYKDHQCKNRNNIDHHADDPHKRCHSVDRDQDNTRQKSDQDIA